ncbi:uncharacterized protein LOC111177173 [Delphinapterus leucas]|uniref:Uncharacterized protein LOC111177173 n=1 Tax=Delphinapterus leucas TaxID=9749 RepID=A0A2Y9NJV3_DELLE|nr:uncharacterized protein LOC111177173 [Delphinapterus leucas]
MPKPRVLQTHTVTPPRAPGRGPCGVGLTSGVQAAETPPLLPEPHPGVPPPKIPELLPSVYRTEEPTVTCQPPPDVHTCAHRPGTHMPSTDKRNSSQTIQINHTDSAHYENSMHVSTCTHSACPAGTFMQTHGHLQLPHLRNCAHVHTHSRAGTSSGTLVHTQGHMGTRTVVRGHVLRHAHVCTDIQPHTLHTHTHHLQACAVCLIANTWAAVGSGLSQPFEAARPGGRPPSPSLQSGNEVRGLSRAGPIGQAGGKRGRVRGSLAGAGLACVQGLLGAGCGSQAQPRHPRLLSSGMDVEAVGRA